MDDWKVYATLEEALADIQFNNGLMRSVELLADDADSTFKYIEEVISWIHDSLGDRDANEKISFCSIFGELAMNAYRTLVKGESCSAGIYLGEKGVLSGSCQPSRFFSPQQIAVLKSRMRVPSTREGSASGGTDLFTDEGNGILILEKEKSIYVAKYFNPLLNPDNSYSLL